MMVLASAALAGGLLATDAQARGGGGHGGGRGVGHWAVSAELTSELAWVASAELASEVSAEGIWRAFPEVPLAMGRELAMGRAFAMERAFSVVAFKF